MQKRRKMIASNFKDYLDPIQSVAIAREVSAFASANGKMDYDIVLAPNADAFGGVANAIVGSGIGLCTQNISGEKNKTIEYLERYNCSHAIIGHSSVRYPKEGKLEEDDKTINKKMRHILSKSSKLEPILCIGETLEAKELGKTYEVLEKQLSCALDFENLSATGPIAQRLLIAYEPIWAISANGAKAALSSMEANAIIGEIRGNLQNMFGPQFGESVRILYGGSVDARNAKEFVSSGEIDGVLIGKASTIPQGLIEILKSIGRLTP